MHPFHLKKITNIFGEIEKCLLSVVVLCTLDSPLHKRNLLILVLRDTFRLFSYNAFLYGRAQAELSRRPTQALFVPPACE